jgi:hypothetical protein
MSVQIELDLRSELGSIRDQGARPTCLAYAVSAAHEHARASLAYLSPEYLHYFAGIRAPSGGRSMKQVAKALETAGQPEEARYPFPVGGPPAGWSPPLGLETFRWASKRMDGDAGQVSEAIRRARVPVLGMSVPESFFVPKAPWVLSAGGTVRGLHAVAAVGLGRHRGNLVVLIRNSWGGDWGDFGHAWIDDEFIAKHLREVLVLTHEVTA